MSDSAYKAHAIHSTLRQLLDLQKDEELLQLVPLLNDDQAWQFERVFEIARAVESNLESTPSTLTSLGALKSINGLLQQAFTELSSFRANRNPGHVTNADSHADGVIAQLSGFAGRPTQFSEEGMAKLVSDLRDRTQGVVREITKEKDALASKVNELTALVSTQAAKIDELTAAVETQKKEALAVTTEVNAAYAKTEGELRTQFGGELEAMRAGYATLESTTKIAAEETLATLRRKEEEVKRIVKVVGDRGITGNYQSTANAEAESADSMRRLTIGFFVAGVLIAGAVLVAHLFPSLSPVPMAAGGPWELALRLLTALAIAAPAFYTARESARHRTNSDRARQRELELASLGPFIELLPEETRREIVKNMTDRYFGTEVEPHEAKSIVDPKDAIALAKTAIEGLVKVAK